MAEKKAKKPSTTQKWAAKKKKDTTSRDVPPIGQSRETAKKIEARRKYLQSL